MRPILALLLSILCLPLFGQTVKVTWGGMEKIGGQLDSYIPLGTVDDNYYAIQLDKKDGRLIKVGPNMDILSQKPMVSGQKKFDVDDALLINGQIHAYTSEYEKKVNTNFVRVTTFDLNGKATGNKYKKIAAVRVEKNNHKSDFKYYFSQDTSALLMLHYHDMRNKDDAKLTLTVTSTEDYSEIWEGTVTLPYENRDFTIISAAVRSTGEVILLATIKGDEGKRLEKYSSRVFSFNNSTDYTDAELKLDDKFISSARIEHTEDGKLVVTGFYNDLKRGKNEGIEGAFIGRTNAEYPENLELNTLKMDSRTKSSITLGGSFAKLFQADELNAYRIREFQIDGDGSGYVIAEQRVIVETESRTATRRIYYFNHLIVYRFNSSGEIEWISAIPKKQSTAVSSTRIGIGPLALEFWHGSVIRFAYKYNSFVSIEKDGKLYILYNDHKKNGNAKTIRDTKLMNNKKAAQATLVTVEEDGKWKKKQLFSGKDIGVVLETSASFSIKNDGFIISAERGKKLQYGLLNP